MMWSKLRFLPRHRHSFLPVGPGSSVENVPSACRTLSKGIESVSYPVDTCSIRSKWTIGCSCRRRSVPCASATLRLPVHHLLFPAPLPLHRMTQNHRSLRPTIMHLPTRTPLRVHTSILLARLPLPHPLQPLQPLHPLHPLLLLRFHLAHRRRTIRPLPSALLCFLRLPAIDPVHHFFPLTFLCATTLPYATRCTLSLLPACNDPC